jgi:hypothetical protein
LGKRYVWEAAADWLRELLESGPLPAKGIGHQALSNGFPKRILWKASTRLGAVKRQHGLHEVDLRNIFCFETSGTVSNDWGVRHNNHWYQLQRETRRSPRPSVKVAVAEWLDGPVHVLAKSQELAYAEITDQVLERDRRKAG